MKFKLDKKMFFRGMSWAGFGGMASSLVIAQSLRGSILEDPLKVFALLVLLLAVSFGMFIGAGLLAWKANKLFL